MNYKKICKTSKVTAKILGLIMLFFCGISNNGFQVFAEGIWQVNYGTEKKADRYFYEKDAKISLEIPLDIFEKSEDQLRYRYERVRTGGTVTDSPTIWRPAWNIDETTNSAKTMVYLPAVEGTEQEYRFYFGMNENMQFASETIVVDTLAPVLEKFEITDADGQPLDLEETDLYYTQNSEKGCVKISLTINDQGTYFDPNAVVLEYRSETDESWKQLKYENWSGIGRQQKGSYLFDGTPFEESVFEFRVSYQDRAGNLMTLTPGVEVREESAVFYAKKRVKIDHCVPEMSVLTFTKPVCMFREENTLNQGIAEDTITNAETRMYYQSAADIRFAIDDGDFSAADVLVTVYQRENREKNWNVEGIVYKGSDIFRDEMFSFIIPYEEGETYFTIAYTDSQGNPLVYSRNARTSKIGEAYEDGIRDGIYISPVFVMDSKAPQLISADYTAAENHGNFVQGDIVFLEQNLDMENTVVNVRASDRNGKSFNAEEERRYSKSWSELMASGIAVNETGGRKKLTLELKTEANYTITITCMDKTQQFVQHQKTVCIDHTAPEITIDYPETETGHKISKKSYEYFTKEKTSVCIKARDCVSGVKELCCTYQEENGESKTEIVTAIAQEQTDLNVFSYNLELPLGFKGTVAAYAVDHHGNAEPSEARAAAGIIVETEKLHEDCADSALAVLDSPSKTPEYYNRDVEICFRVRDSYSGVRKIAYHAGNQLNEIIDSYGAEGSEIEVDEIVRYYTIPAAANDQNHVSLGLYFEDNAGHQSALLKEDLPIIHIDTVKPEVEIQYDNNDAKNGKYYQAERTAVVTVKERNFDPNDVKFQISGPDVSIGRWKHSAAEGCTGGNAPENTGHTDQCKWTASVHFHSDGNYSFGFECVDLAGNKGMYRKKDVFVIDKTVPTMKVHYSPQEVKNGFYYHAPRTAEVIIEEHNFQKEHVMFMITAENEGQKKNAPQISGWSSVQDTHKATIFFDREGIYRFQITCVDLAGNSAEEYQSETFVIDLTEPEISILEIEDRSANNAAVTPVITVKDTNYDFRSVNIILEGSNKGVTAFQCNSKDLEDGQVIQLLDLENIQEMDDLYTLTVSASDLAGNYSEEKVGFSVNRYGSVYTFDEETEKLLGANGKYYTHTVPELVVTESNVDTLEFQEITCSRNGKLEILEAGRDYAVSVQEDENSWKQYIYQIFKDNFQDDGQYILTIYSEDRASNASNNHSKGKRIEFVLDTVPPELLISGVEDQMHYRENSRAVTIAPEDNMQLAEVVVTLGKEKSVYSAAEIEKMNGKININVKSSDEWQTMKVEVFDAAGNEPTVRELSFLINTNRMIHFLNNKPLVYGTFAVIFVFAGSFCFVIKKRRYLSKSS